uniref:Rho termination factor N-terminal domain-containing protein n=1 Tax=viral metagenome TaxID=1070528 RepID=A0A6C0H961_9ZZZZ
MYLNQKISQQNHKINGMFDLVNTMAQELNYIRSSESSGISLQPFADQRQQVLANLSGGFRQSDSELIQVSDEEDDEDDDEEDDEDDEDDDEDDEDEDDEDEDDDGEDDEDHDNDDYEEKNTKNIKIINILSDSIYGSEKNDVEIIDDNDDDDNHDDDNDDDNDLSNDDDEPVELIDLINHDVLEDQTNYNTFTKNDKIEIINNDDISNIDLSILKTINISNSSSNENIDYKKMSLTKLREIVVERNLATDSSKMKKNELLKLLE